MIDRPFYDPDSDDPDSDDPDSDEHDEDLDEEFPLGDGIADTEAIITCPYCGEENEIAVDPGGGASQQYVEDCQVCCQPWRVTVTYHGDGSVEAHADVLDD